MLASRLFTIVPTRTTSVVSLITRGYADKARKFVPQGAKVNTLEDGSQFIIRPSAAEIQAQKHIVTEADLPPMIFPKQQNAYIERVTSGKKVVLTSEQRREMARLRAEDPVHWTRSRLQAKFGCSPWDVTYYSKLPAWRSKQLEADVEQKWRRMGLRAQVIRINRVRRRSLW
ncbi:hypothetical protein GQ42DRAFT_160631 [Ramicandelaber brevisporus]|nr:hypothetical protein GQ42DRAFT_160631 [Ramicandelaber brevisporus]